MANGASKTKGLAKFPPKFKGLAVSFLVQSALLGGLGGLPAAKALRR